MIWVSTVLVMNGSRECVTKAGTLTSALLHAPSVLRASTALCWALLLLPLLQCLVLLINSLQWELSLAPLCLKDQSLTKANS